MLHTVLLGVKTMFYYQREDKVLYAVYVDMNLKDFDSQILGIPIATPTSKP
jgi:hypothetical protein